jgi:Ca2+:H+ antiporter
VHSLLHALTGSRLNVLLIFIPVAWAIRLWSPQSTWLFALAALSIIPLAGLIGEATEDLAGQTGPTLGGFLNATFGNAAELIIGFEALQHNHVALVKASITGSIIGNLLLVLGLSILVGGMGRPRQRFNRTAASNASVMLFLAVVALIMPAMVDLAAYGTLRAHTAMIDRFSIGTSLVLIVAYAGSLLYSFSARQDLLRPGDRSRRRQGTISRATGVLVAATALTAIQSELLIGSLQPMLARFGVTELFVGVVIVAIVGNAAEHYTAISAARADQMTLSIEIAVGSSAQIALLAAPVLVLLSFAIGRPMSLVFSPLEIVAIGLSVISTALVVLDGESNWVEGLQLLSVYVILALAFYFLPG